MLQLLEIIGFIKMDFEIRGENEQKHSIIKIKKETFEKWKARLSERMNRMSEEINAQYAAIGKGSLANGTYIEEGPNSISMSTDTMVIIWLDWGTKAHGPVKAPFLHFFIDGVEIYTKWVQGIKAHRIIQLSVDRFIADVRGWYRG